MSPPRGGIQNIYFENYQRVESVRALRGASVQRDVDRGQRLHSPAGVLVRRGELPPHERPDERGEPALDDALSHRAHEGQLQERQRREGQRSQRKRISFIDTFRAFNHLLSYRESTAQLPVSALRADTQPANCHLNATGREVPGARQEMQH